MQKLSKYSGVLGRKNLEIRIRCMLILNPLVINVLSTNIGYSN